jgi:hypothetical protein
LETIRDFEGIHKGEPVAILGNGPSLVDSLPFLEDIKTIGINASLDYLYSDYWVALDSPSVWRAGTQLYTPKYFFTSTLPRPVLPHAKTIVIPSSFKKSIAWSDDLGKIIYPCRATVWFALQIAVWMGFDPIYIVGFDLHGPRPKGHVLEGEVFPATAVQRQLQLMGYLKALLDSGRVDRKIYNCSIDSLCTSLPYYSFLRKEAEEEDSDIEVVFVNGKLEERLF